MTTNTIIQILAATGSTLGFGIIYKLEGKKLVAASIGGGLGWMVYVFFKARGNTEPGSFLFAAMAITLFSEIMARVLKTPVTSTLIASLIPLVPGSGVYFTMSYFIQGYTDMAAKKGVETLLITVAITVGILMISAFSEIFNKVKRYNLRKRAILARKLSRNRRLFK